MRKYGCILLVFGFLWVSIVVVEVGPVARALSYAHNQTMSGQPTRTYTSHEMAVAYQEAAYRVAHFGQWGFIGGLLMLVGGLLLAKSGVHAPAAKKPPLLSETGSLELRASSARRKTATRRWCGAGLIGAAILSDFLLGAFNVFPTTLLSSQPLGSSTGGNSVESWVYEVHVPTWFQVAFLGASGLGLLLLLVPGRKK
jgi:hypothetical protein